MIIFNKKKKESPSLWVSLDKERGYAKEANKYSFIYALKDDEIDSAAAWAASRKAAISIDYIYNDISYYKIMI